MANINRSQRQTFALITSLNLLSIAGKLVKIWQTFCIQSMNLEPKKFQDSCTTNTNLLSLCKSKREKVTMCFSKVPCSYELLTL